MDELKELLRQAAEAVEVLPDHLQEAAFTALVNHGLGTTPRPDSKSLGTKEDASDPATAAVKDGPRWERELLKGLPEAHVVQGGTRPEQTVWAVTKLWAEGEEAHRNSVRRTIKDKLGLSPQDPGNTSTTLGNLVPKYLSREQRDGARGYAYEPTANALKIFQSDAI